MNSTAHVPTTGALGVAASSDVVTSVREQSPQSRAKTPLEHDRAAAAIIRAPIQSYPGRGIGMVRTAASTSYFVATDTGVVRVGDAGVVGIDAVGHSRIVCNRSDTGDAWRTLAANHAAHRQTSVIALDGPAGSSAAASGDFRIICCGHISAANISVALAVPNAIHAAVSQNGIGVASDRSGFGEVFLGPASALRVQHTTFSVISMPAIGHERGSFRPMNYSESYRYSTPVGDLTAYTDHRNPSQVAYWWTDAGQPPGTARPVQMYEPNTAA